MTKAGWLTQSLALPNGIPSHDTFRRVFARLGPGRFGESPCGCFRPALFPFAPWPVAGYVVTMCATTSRIVS